MIWSVARNATRSTAPCATVRSATGKAKIWERGYLNPTSFHTTIVGKHELPVTNAPASPLGYSRGYALWGISMPMRDAPVGYYFEVITKGYGGMPNYAAQISPADRWRIIAYVRALQYSQHATDLPPELLQKVNTGKVEPTTNKAGGHP
ncbi:MAG: cytochrome c [Gemmataceae bacterium]